jgi:hypothetical protein
VCSDVCSNVFNLTCSHHAMCTLLWLLLLLLLLQPFYPGDEDDAVEKWPLRLHRYDVRTHTLLHYILHSLVVSTCSTCCIHKLYMYVCQAQCCTDTCTVNVQTQLTAAFVKHCTLHAHTEHVSHATQTQVVVTSFKWYKSLQVGERCLALPAGWGTNSTMLPATVVARTSM